ncbi:class I SAM-dependent methyltransferase [Haloprofundus halophilus]|uniref:class I SAM-dependent methyltransferase n=1 Tax=Haloprofundus halophilus TaxID=2283527 RepID=UPI000E44CA93|nr:class I SAM-dependent methyltransferase [Haloprofundus halophilus]
MSRPQSYSFQRYLAAKERVDDRALHRPTLDAVTADLAAVADARDEVRVLDLGGGLGSMLRRLLDWNRLPDRVSYTLVDRDGTSLERGRQRCVEWASEAGYAVDGGDESGESDEIENDAGHDLVLSTATEEIGVSFVAADAFDFLEATERRWDLVVAAAFLDVVDLDSALPAIFSALAADGRWYFPVTFDGETGFAPTPEPELEARIVDAYHASMDAPNRPGGSRTGRELLAAAPEAGGELLAAGGSDWVVTPPYAGDEAYFLHHLLSFFEDSVGESGEIDGFDAWADERHAAVERGELSLVAHHLDVYGRC